MILFNDIDNAAPHLFDGLLHHYGPNTVFRDTVFRAFNVLVVVVGPEWSRTVRELDADTHVYRLAIAQALRERIHVVPVLVGGGRVPQESNLPDDLKLLATLTPLYLDENLLDPLNTFLGAVENITRVLERTGAGCIDDNDGRAIHDATDLLISYAESIRDALRNEDIERLVDVIEGRSRYLDLALERTIGMFSALRSLQGIVDRLAAWQRCITAADSTDLDRAFQRADENLRRVRRRLRYPQGPTVPTKPVQMRRPRTPDPVPQVQPQPPVQPQPRPDPTPSRTRPTSGCQTILLAVIALLLGGTLVINSGLVPNFVAEQPTATDSATARPSVTATATVTPTPSATASVTASPTGTATATPTLTATQSVTPSPTSPFAQGQRLMVINSGGAWMRQDPSVASETILAILDRGECVDVADPDRVYEPGTEQYWVNTRMMSGQPTGWIEAASLTDSAAPVVGAAQAANLRAGDATVFQVVGQLAAGDEVQLNGRSTRSTGWLSITTADGQNAWVFGDLLDLPENLCPLPSVQPPPLPPTSTPLPATNTPFPTFTPTQVSTFPGVFVPTFVTATALPQGPTADFSVSNVTQLSHCRVNVTFRNRSSNASSFQWSFGDGETSTLSNPTHEFYRGNGPATSSTTVFFRVVLTAIGVNGSRDVYAQEIAVNFPAGDPQYGFCTDAVIE